MANVISISYDLPEGSNREELEKLYVKLRKAEYKLVGLEVMRVLQSTWLLVTATPVSKGKVMSMLTKAIPAGKFLITSITTDNRHTNNFPAAVEQFLNKYLPQ